MQLLFTLCRQWGALLLLLTTIPAMVHSQEYKPIKSTVFGRRYKAGQTSRYSLTTEEIQNGQWASTTTVVCELTVVYDTAGIPYEEVHWLSKIRAAVKDTVDQSQDALTVKPYRISLDPAGRIDVPKIEVPSMTGAIEDFNTFFVAISPLIGATHLNRAGDTFEVKTPIKADFSNGANILKGEDCFSVSMKMVGETKNAVMLHTAFMPTPKPGFMYLLDEMNTPVVKDTVNNFQMVMPLGNDKYNLQYGREMFYINSTVSKHDGKISYAQMSNTLTLHLKVFCDKSYANCQADVPFTEQRNLTLKLL